MYRIRQRRRTLQTLSEQLPRWCTGPERTGAFASYNADGRNRRFAGETTPRPL